MGVGLLMENLRKLIKQVGYKQTMEILIGYPYYISIHDFYGILNRFSYSNAFLRVKKKLIKYGLIKLKSKPKRIKITSKGREIYLGLIMYNNFYAGLIEPVKMFIRRKLKVRFYDLRRWYATTLRMNGVLSEIVDLLQGRIGTEIFVRSYFRPDIKQLIEKVASR